MVGHATRHHLSVKRRVPEHNSSCTASKAILFQFLDAVFLYLNVLSSMNVFHVRWIKASVRSCCIQKKCFSSYSSSLLICKIQVIPLQTFLDLKGQFQQKKKSSRTCSLFVLLQLFKNKSKTKKKCYFQENNIGKSVCHYMVFIASAFHEFVNVVISIRNI